MKLLVTLALGLVAAGAAAQDIDAKTLLDEAIDAMEWNLERDWAYTTTTLDDEKIWVARHDPRKPPDERWTLVTVDRRSPTRGEVKEFRKQKSSQHERRPENNRISASIGDSPLTLIEETDAHWSFGFVPDLDNDTLSESVDAVVHIAKRGPFVELLEIRNQEIIKAGLGTRLSHFSMNLAYQQIGEDGPVVPETVDINVAGRVFFMIPFNEKEAIRYSDFEFAGEAL